MREGLRIFEILRSRKKGQRERHTSRSSASLRMSFMTLPRRFASENFRRESLAGPWNGRFVMNSSQSQPTAPVPPNAWDAGGVGPCGCQRHKVPKLRASKPKILVSSERQSDGQSARTCRCGMTECVPPQNFGLRKFCTSSRRGHCGLRRRAQCATRRSRRQGEAILAWKAGVEF
jgi:hypothetical protein